MFMNGLVLCLVGASFGTFLVSTVDCQFMNLGFIEAHKQINDLHENEENFKEIMASSAIKYLQQQQHVPFTPDVAVLEEMKEQTLFSDENVYNVSKQCLSDIFTLLGHLKNLTASQWALQMIDAQAKLPSGVLQGDLTWLGSYDQCLNVTAVATILNGSSWEDTEELFKGKYCLANLHLGNVSSAGETGQGIGPALRVGMCIPNTCSDIDAKHLIYTDLFPIDLLMNRSDINAEVMCHTKLSLGDDWRAILAIVICSILGVFIVIGTLYDICLLQIPQFIYKQQMSEHSIGGGDFTQDNLVNPDDVSTNHEKTPLLGHLEDQDSDTTIIKGNGRFCQFMLSFSIYHNGAKILSAKQGASSLKCVNGIRFLSMSWVILGHSYRFGIGTTKNIVSFLGLFKRWSFMAILNGTFSVDSFFFLSGLLLTYLVMKEMDRKKGNLKLNWGMYYFHRFWRLTPPYMLVLMIDTCLFRHMGEGPMWPALGTELDYCATTWWQNLLYINNFFSMSKMCMAWSWYLANDMQFYVIAPLILIPLYRSWKLGGVVILVFLSACLISTGVISSVNDIPVGFGNGGNDINESFDMIYTKPWCRIGPYLVGMTTGFILYKTNCQVKLKLRYVLLGWAIAAICSLSVLYGVFDAYNGHPMSISAAAFYNTMARTVWGASLGWVVFACSTGYGGFVNTFLSWEAFIPLARLTYCAYLVHPLVENYYYLTQQTLVFGSDLNEIYIFLGNIVVSYGLAFCTSLVFEAPFMGLEKALFKRDKSV